MSDPPRDIVGYLASDTRSFAFLQLGGRCGGEGVECVEGRIRAWGESVKCVSAWYCISQEK